VFPVGKITAAQMRGLAKIASDLGDGDIRLTVWQNLLISGVPDDKVALAQAAIAALGLTTEATSIAPASSLARFRPAAASLLRIPRSRRRRSPRGAKPRVALDTPVNIHLTGCHHSCAQHYIGDIGLLAARVAVNEAGDTVDGYITCWSAAGFGPEARLGREIYQNVTARGCACARSRHSERLPRAPRRRRNVPPVQQAA
jgi:ferredoxin-nitrite reductase